MSGSIPPAATSRLGPPADADPEAFRLICGFCDGVADLANTQRLERLLQTPDGMALYLSVADLDAMVRWRLRWRSVRQPFMGPGIASPSRTATVAPPKRRPEPIAPVASPSRLSRLSRRLGEAFATFGSPVTIAIAVQSLVILAAVVAVIVGQWRGAPEPASSFNAAAFGNAAARITGLHDVAWAADGKVRQVSELLPEGAQIDLDRGLVEIVHAHGARVVLEGPAALVVKGRAAATLDRGRLTAKVTKGRAGRGGRDGDGPFVVHTPKAVVMDIGTEFGVEVGGDGVTAVHVFEGLVDIASASATATAALRVSAGQSAGLDSTGRAVPVDHPPPRFVRGLPQTARRPAMPSRRITEFFWDDAAARVIYSDSFAGAGPFDGTTPASRGGVGKTAWSAPPVGWQCGSTLDAGAAGAALLPLVVEPGCIYRVAVEMNVVSGGIGWAAVGFADDSAAIVGLLSHAWLMQRHETVKQSNQYFAGPHKAGSVGRGDRLTGPHTREAVLDTTGPTWKAFFLVDGKVVASHRYDGEPPAITHVGLSLFANTKASLRNFCASVIRQDTMSRQP